MKNKYNLIAFVLALAFAFSTSAFAASNTARGFGSGPIGSGDVGLPGSYWYNGDFDGINGLANERNTIVSQAGTYDDFNVTGGGVTIASVYSNNLVTPGFIFTGADWEIRTGVSLGNAGTLVASGTTSTPVVTFNGQDGFGLLGAFVQVVGINVTLAPGTYWLNVTPVDAGSGRSFNSTTHGANCVGTPCGNNGNSFFNSTFFGSFFDDANNFIGNNPTDFSMGVIAVPEPATVALLTCGLGALVIAIRRRRS